MINVSKYKKLLEDERARLETELASVAEKNPNDPNSWIARPPEQENQADPIDAADDVEDYIENAGIALPLEQQLEQVGAALAAMADGTYGMCSVGGETHPIEEKRLDANPSATTCVAHMN